ncbi:MAG TPA: hypothetical protein VK654_07540 [Nitrospirota bacterium]|nr:hypothetical protein [Nitrospirota bacterium]
MKAIPKIKHHGSIDRHDRVRRVTKFRVVCPNCGASVITESPRSLVWELCPECRRYVWDLSDALMAEALPAIPVSSADLLSTNQ